MRLDDLVIEVLVGLDEGAIIVDEKVLSRADRAACQPQIAWLPQHPAIVPGTVAENLALYGPLDPARLASAVAPATAPSSP